MNRFRQYLLLLLFAGLMLSVLPARAQLGGEELPPGVTEDDVYQVASQMYCDVCAGIPLSTCASPTCFRWRQEIANLLGDGKSEEEIFNFFAVNYGDDVTGVPQREDGRNLALGLPALALLLLGAVVVWRLWTVQQGKSSRALQAAHAAGLREDFARPVPDNVDAVGLAAFLDLVEGKS